MADIDEIRAELKKVMDPELGGNIVDLGMLKEVTEQDGQVDLLIALTIPGCPMKRQFEEDVKKVLSAIDGIKSVNVRFGTLSEEEKKKLMSGRGGGENQDYHPAEHMNRVKSVIAILSGKGGVGKSTATSLLAVELRRRGYSVGVMDSDITGPSIPKMFGVKGPVKGTPMGIFPVPSSTGIKIMSSNLMVPDEDVALIWRGPIMSGAIKQFWQDVFWGDLDVLLVDLPPGTSDATLTVMQSIPLSGAVMVSTPQKLSAMVVRKTVNMAEKLNVPVIGVIENMSYFTLPDGTKTSIFGESNIESVASLAKAPVIGVLGVDPTLTELADNGEIENYSSEQSQALADAFIGALPVKAI